MSFNSSLDFAATPQSLQALDFPFHILLSRYLRESKTFELYDEIFRKLRIDSRLLPLELSPGDSDGLSDLNELMRAFRANHNFGSILVSDPFKPVFMNLVDELTPGAIRCRAVNMVLKHGNLVTGDNCDGQAFLAGARSAHSFDFDDKRVLFFGCGGVSSAVAVALSAKLRAIGLCDLSSERLQNLAKTLKRLHPKLPIELFGDDSSRNFLNFDVFYNGTGLGKGKAAEGYVAASPVKDGDILPLRGAAFDANYTPEKTYFLEQLAARGFSTYNGLSHMLTGSAIHLSQVTGQPFEYNSIEPIYRDKFGKN